ncbi:hypothetical protein NW768_008428 [Fusarium equiseti]|uniref:Uncharacterized protein n=1 Tax=Fusarium equiseti TaxID=61235 RepID=A0ABQ8R6Q2_FUSEQ|nr:hypothetical protein NW768_008428 [Fusarium equiseti]
MTYPQQTYANTVEGFLEYLVRYADFLCVPSAASQYHKLYLDWKVTGTQGVAIDEAACTGHLVNRFSAYGEVSVMAAVLASGLPVYRLKAQLCMARGMFDPVASGVYSNAPFIYHAS